MFQQKGMKPNQLTTKILSAVIIHSWKRNDPIDEISHGSLVPSTQTFLKILRPKFMHEVTIFMLMFSEKVNHLHDATCFFFNLCFFF